MGTRVCSILRTQDLQQSLTSFWYYHNPSTKPYTVSITVGPQALQGFSTLGFSFTITRRTMHRFATSIHESESNTSIHRFGFTTSIHGSTTSIGLQHFRNFAGCPCCSRRFHDLYNNPCCSTNPWHHLWPTTFSKI